MTDETIRCPNCKGLIPLSKALAGQVDSQVELRIASELQRREDEFREKLKQGIAAEREATATKLRAELALERQDLETQLAEKEASLTKARETELALLKREREVQERQKTLELELARKLGEQAKEIENAVTERLTENHRLRDIEKDQQLSSLKRTIEDLKRKAEQGSQQTQGEAAEVELEVLLGTTFPHDLIEPVSKGARGADIIQRVHTTTGTHTGTIVWESKNAKNWSDAWVTKLKDDQRAQKAAVAVLVTTALPAGVRGFGLVDGVWVCDVVNATGLAVALRVQLTQVHQAKVSAEGMATKTEQLYRYLSGTEFKQRIEAIAEAFTSMKADLDKERAAMERVWAKRERQIGAVVTNVSGLYGDVQGIVGASLPEITRLQLPAGGEDAE